MPDQKDSSLSNKSTTHYPSQSNSSRSNIENQPPNTTAPISSDEKGHHTNHKFIYIFIGLTTIISLSLIFFMLSSYHYNNTSMRELTHEEIQQKPTPSQPSLDPSMTTAFSSQEFNYQINIPDDFQLKSTRINLTQIPKPKDAYNESVFLGSITAHKNQEDYTLDEYVAEVLCGGKGLSRDSDEWPQQLYKSCVTGFQKSKISININGYQGITGSYNPYEHSSQIHLFSHKEFIYIFSLSGYETGNIPTQFAEKIMADIIKTFSTQHQSAAPDNWTQYHHQLPFYFSYPKDFTLDESVSFYSPTEEYALISISASTTDSNFSMSDHIETNSFRYTSSYLNPQTQRVVERPIDSEQVIHGNNQFTIINHKGMQYALLHKNQALIIISIEDVIESDITQILSSFELN